MEVGMEAARWVVGKALGPAAGGALEAWAASSELGTNISGLKMELLYAQGMLNNGRCRGREDIVHNPALEALLQELRDLAYNADDALDEVDYFRIQDELDGTYHAADEHAGGCISNHALNARHAAIGIAKMLGLSSSRSASRGDSVEPNEDDTRGVSCGGAWPCRGHGSPESDEQEDEASRGGLCGAWPCGRASRPQPTQPRLPSTDQAGKEEEVHSGCIQKLASGARNTISILGKHLPCNSTPSPVQNNANSNMASNGRRFLCCGRPNTAPQSEHAVKTPKLKFDRVGMSKRIKEITEQLKPVCAKVSTILNLELLDSNRSIAQCIATSLDTMLSKKQGRIPLLTHSAAPSRPMTTSELIEPEIYGREDEIKKIIYDITKGDYCDKDLTVLPIVGPGGIGKTTLTQVIYKELQHHFEEKIWVCVSTTFSVYKLTLEVVDNMKLNKNDILEKLIEEKLKSKKFLLILDDMWSCSDDDWRRFLVPFTRGQTKGSIVLVTTRFPVVAQMVKTTNNWIDLKAIDNEAFKKLFVAYVFGDKNSSNDHGGLINIGLKIVEKLKGSPLAAKTVGRLLKKHLDLDHWNRVLESKEWELENGEHDIMPALKLSYDYLPFHLQQCFNYCALFPEDYKFKAEELIQLWIGLDVLHSHRENRRIEDIGLNHLTELVNSGFFRKEEDEEDICYVIHDLLHELALKISSHECLSINSTNVGSAQIPASIRYLSVHIDGTGVKDRMTFDACQKDLSSLVKRLKVGSLRSFMLFGQYQGSFVKTIESLLKEAKALRVIFLSKASYNFKKLLRNFPYCVHLRYLRMNMFYESIMLPDIISRFYHLRVLDLQLCSKLRCSTKDMSNLIKLRHFLVERGEMHSCICEVGKLKSIQGLRRFEVRKENQGFELSQIGHLTGICGSLSIGGLEKIELMEEADEAKLINKTHLHELILHWDSGRSNKDPALEEHVLEKLKPSSNLLKLCIRGHGGFTCPSWLGTNLSVPNLESFYLDDVSWKHLPLPGELWLVDEQGKEYQSCTQGQSFSNLKQLELVKIPKLKKWIGNGPCELFSHLKVLIIRDCPELVELPLTHHTGCEPEHGDHMAWFSKLELVEIVGCPKLSSLPCIPWSSAMCSAKISQVGSSLKRLDLRKNYASKYSLTVEGSDALDSAFWKVLSFTNLSKLEKLKVTRCPPLSLDNLQMLSSLKTLQISESSNAFLVPEGDGQVGYRFPVERFSIEQSGASGEALTRLLSYFPNLRDLEVSECEMLTVLSVVGQHKKTGAPERLLLSSAVEVEEKAQILPHEQQQDDTSEEEEIAATSEGLLLLPPQLQKLEISKCPNLVLCTLSNLTSLTDLSISGCGELSGEGMLPLLAQGRLTELTICGTPNFFAGSKPSLPHEQEFPSSSSKLQQLDTDDVAGVLAAPICTLLSSSLTELYFFEDKEAECFTEEQAEALHLLTSLEEIRFWSCDKLQGLPAGLHRLPILKRLNIFDCAAMRSLPKDGLPSSLQELEIDTCPAIRSLPKDCLPSSLQILKIISCPAIRSLPKLNDLPSSLRELDVLFSESEELRRQCRKLIGTIPIVNA